MIVDRYYYHQLNKQEQAIYKAFYNGAMAHQDIIPIPVRGEFSQESFERIFMAMTRDNPLIYFLNQSACSTASDMFGHIAICPQYFFTKEKVKEYNRKIEKVVNELAGQLHLLECNDYEKELRVHDWICQNIEYDYEGTDKDKISRVIASHNILGVFAYHKAQCEGIAKALKVLLNAVNVKCIVVTGDSVKSGQSVPHAWNIVNIGEEPYQLDVTLVIPVAHIGDTIKLSESQYSAAQRIGESYELFVIATEASEAEYIYIKNPYEKVELNRVVKEWEWVCDKYDKNKQIQPVTEVEVVDDYILKNILPDYFNRQQRSFLQDIIMSEDDINYDDKYKISIEQINSIADFYTSRKMIDVINGKMMISMDKKAALKKILGI